MCGRIERPATVHEAAFSLDKTVENRARIGSAGFLKLCIRKSAMSIDLICIRGLAEEADTIRMLG